MREPGIGAGSGGGHGNWRDGNGPALGPVLPLAFVVACAIALGAAVAWGAQALLPGGGAPGWCALGALACAVAAAGGALRAELWRSPCIVLAACAVGAALAWNAAGERRTHGPAGPAGSAVEGPVALVGTVASAPRIDGAGADRLAAFAHQDASLVFELEVESAEQAGGPVAVDASVLVRVQEMGDLPARGQAVRVRGWYRPSKPPMNPGARGGRGDGSVVVPRVSLISAIDASGDPVEAVQAPVRRMRAAADASLTGALPAWSTKEARALVVAMTTGVRKPGLEHPAADFRAAGMSHVLAISGFNVAVLVAFAAAAMRMMGASTRARAVAAVAVAALFLAVTEPEVSVLRAGLGAGLAAIASMQGGRARGLGTLGVVASVTMLLDIESLASPGFQLSYGVVVALLMLASGPAERWEGRADAAWRAVMPARLAKSEAAGIVRGGLVEAIVSGMVAWTVSTPIALWHGGFASAFSAPLSVLTMPLAATVTVAGVGAMVTAPVLAAVAHAFGAAAAGCAQALAWMAHEAARMPGGCWWTGRPAVWWVVATVVLSCVAWRGRASWMRRAAWCALVPAGVLLWCGTAVPLAGAPPPGILRAETLDVGNGSCHLLRAGATAILLDAGSSSDDCAGSRRVVPSLAALGVRSLDALVVSNTNMDNYSAVPEVLRAFAVKQLVVSAAFERRLQVARDGPLAELRRAIQEAGAPLAVVGAGDRLEIGDTALHVLHPTTGVRMHSSNDESIVLRASHRGAAAVRAAMLFSGDIDEEAVAALLAAGGVEPAAAIELPHHGSWRTGVAAMVAGIAPAVVLQSTSSQRIQHDRWAQALAQVRRGITAVDGALRCEVRPDGHAALWHLEKGAWIRK